MMKKANEKQSLYINRLSYTLYKLCGCENKKIIIFPDEAEQLPADMAEDMIKELKQKIYKKELENYVFPYLYQTDKLEEIKSIKIGQYKKIEKVKPVDTTLYVVTTDGEEYRINGNSKLLIGKTESSLQQVYEALVKAINYDKGVRLYVSDNLASISVKDQERDTYIASIIEIINAIIEIMGNKMPISWDNKYKPEHIVKLQIYINERNQDVAAKFKAVMGNAQQAQDFCTLLKAGQEHYFGLTEKE
ncbi:hypothetical protein [Clostridium magnum]|uniref:Uncharacterized protein n=1 Tax=Clostridium magnum DSM 2767 TaxID=1121326 RepID=A0A161XEV2_9CLOT|nr:hypothetical protein [Clostridium magnum]KZL92976.1 hypothetical protein CLMAG_27900 [Clostridium magnum DSM 2767]SHJ21989.1 hypothetical protein SAMN02745944_05560 [Clostridium magnum DSM 2767]